VAQDVGFNMARFQPKIHPILPLLDMRQRVEENRMAQAKLGREISALKSGDVLVNAQKRLIDLKTDLIALNVEMRMRTGQVSGND
jgi:hypothetical protein